MADAHFAWQDEGWSPFTVHGLWAEVAGLNGTYFTFISGEREGAAYELHVIEPSIYERLTEDVSLIFAHAKFEHDNAVLLSFLDVKEEELRIKGFYSLSDAKREHEKRGYGIEKDSTRYRRKTVMRQAFEKAMWNTGGNKKM